MKNYQKHRFTCDRGQTRYMRPLVASPRPLVSPRLRHAKAALRVYALVEDPRGAAGGPSGSGGGGRPARQSSIRWARRQRMLTSEPRPGAGDDDLIELNVGGRLMQTTRSTLLQVPGSRLAAMFRKGSEAVLGYDCSGRVWLDQDPNLFQLVLRYLRELKMSGGQRRCYLPAVKPEDEAPFRRLLSYLGLLPYDNATIPLALCHDPLTDELLTAPRPAAMSPQTPLPPGPAVWHEADGSRGAPPASAQPQPQPLTSRPRRLGPADTLSQPGQARSGPGQNQGGEEPTSSLSRGVDPESAEPQAPGPHGVLGSAHGAGDRGECWREPGAQPARGGAGDRPGIKLASGQGQPQHHQSRRPGHNPHHQRHHQHQQHHQQQQQHLHRTGTVSAKRSPRHHLPDQPQLPSRSSPPEAPVESEDLIPETLTCSILSRGPGAADGALPVSSSPRGSPPDSQGMQNQLPRRQPSISTGASSSSPSSASSPRSSARLLSSPSHRQPAAAHLGGNGNGSSGAASSSGPAATRLLPQPTRPNPGVSQLFYISTDFSEARGLRVSVYTENDIRAGIPGSGSSGSGGSGAAAAANGAANSGAAARTASDPFDIFVDTTYSDQQLSLTFVSRRELLPGGVFLGLTSRAQLDRKGAQIPCYGWKSNGCTYNDHTGGGRLGSGGRQGMSAGSGLAGAASAGQSARGGSRAGMDSRRGDGGEEGGVTGAGCMDEAVGAVPLWKKGDSVELIMRQGQQHNQLLLKVNGRAIDVINRLPSFRNWSWYVGLWAGGDISCAVFQRDQYAVYWGDYTVKRYM